LAEILTEKRVCKIRYSCSSSLWQFSLISRRASPSQRQRGAADGRRRHGNTRDCGMRRRRAETAGDELTSSKTRMSEIRKQATDCQRIVGREPRSSELQ